MKLSNTTSVVTGAQQGIGRATAVALARHGCDIVLNFLDDESAAKSLVDEIEALGRTAVPVQGDIADRSVIESLMQSAEELGGIDILVNNAGIFPRVDFFEMTPGDWDRVHDVNLKAAFFCMQAAGRSMVKRGKAGAIINIASSAAFTGPPLGVHYAASKGGMIGMTRAAARALAPHGIRVNAVAPGLTDTAQPRAGMTEDEIAAASAATPLGRISLPEDIANASVFLASDDARQITGQIIHVNGGLQFR